MKSIWVAIVLCLTTFACSAYAEQQVSDENESYIETPSELGNIVDKQLEAFNNHDLETFLTFFHPEIESYKFSGELQLQGIDALRERFAQAFIYQPNEVVEERIISGNYVIDKIKVTYVVNGQTVTDGDVVIYTIEEDLIRRMTFLK